MFVNISAKAYERYGPQSLGGYAARLLQGVDQDIPVEYFYNIKNEGASGTSYDVCIKGLCETIHINNAKTDIPRLVDTYYAAWPEHSPYTELSALRLDQD